LSDALDRSITVTEIASGDGPIDAPLDTTAAFVGRALRGPLNSPVELESFAGFRRHFGGMWRRSSLGPAVQHFFDHGGRKLYVVRVANNARGAMICLPAIGGVLVLHALEPGSTENIRAAVDYDGVREQRFNLTIQRVSPDTGLVVDQEIYRELSCRVDELGFVGDELLTSSIVRAQLPTPGGRPAETEQGYVAEAQRGSDGMDLSDYDVVGCNSRSTGIFALNDIDHFGLLYVPPPARDQDLGPAAVLAAELYCRKRGAMLVMDPPRAWRSVRKAVEGIREAGYSSPNILTYFPRVQSRGDFGSPPRTVGGAVAGLLCKLDRKLGPWEEIDQVGFGLSGQLVPAMDVTVDDAQMLVKEGINVIAGRAAGRAHLCGSVTLARGGQMNGNFSSLTVRRLCLEITNTIDHATRWTAFAPNTASVAERVNSLVHAYMCSLADAGAFTDDMFVVKCDAGLHSSPVNKDRGITILLAFHPVGADEPVSLTLHQTMSGCRVATTAFAPVIDECA
jgi:GNAT superfamily N-acetyltransferase